MAIPSINPSVTIPSLGSFPLNEEQIYAATFKSLDEEDPDTPPEEPKEGESAKSIAMRKKREADRAERKEQRKLARAAAKEKIESAIKEQLAEITQKVSEAATCSALLAAEAPAVLGLRTWLLTYDVTYIKPLEVQWTALLATAAASVVPPTPQAAATATQTAAALKIQLDEAKDKQEQMILTYRQHYDMLKTLVDTVANDYAYVAGSCAVLQIVGIPAITSFLGVFSSVLAGMRLMIETLKID